MKKTAIAGYMGSGKSTLTHLAAFPGSRVVDADRTARELIVRNPVIKENLSKEFGKDVVKKGNVIFPLLRERAFGSIDGIKRLNKIVHPELIEEICRLVNGVPGGRVILDCALVSYWKIESWFDTLIWVEASDRIRFERLQKKPQDISETALKNRMRIQESLFSRPAPDSRWIYISNESSFDNLRNTAVKAGLINNTGKNINT